MKEELLKKAQDDFKQIIEEAYKKGFEDGVKYMSPEPEIINDEEIEWIDLGLPSGNLWAVGGNKIYPSTYPKDNDNLLPTFSDCNELLKCQLYSSYHNGSVSLTLRGINLKTLTIANHHTAYKGEICFIIWLKSKLSTELTNEAFLVKDNSANRNDINQISYERIFAGELGQILYCKHPEK
ncbi:MAG: hypothetical protein IKN91_00210 [Paludibacteraceae bacterium]|nr:hypothetical protein [Paludibacteraceae bacterium]